MSRPPCAPLDSKGPHAARTTALSPLSPEALENPPPADPLEDTGSGDFTHDSWSSSSTGRWDSAALNVSEDEVDKRAEQLEREERELLSLPHEDLLSPEERMEALTFT